MIRQMAIALTFPGFNDLGCLVTPIFLLMGHFLYRFSTSREKMKKIYRLEVRIFAKFTIELHKYVLFHLPYNTHVIRVLMKYVVADCSGI